MPETLVDTACSLPGVEAAALVDMQSGECLALKGITTQTAQMARLNACAIRSQLQTLQEYGDEDPVEDWVMTTRARYELIRFLPQPEAKGVFLYLSLSRERANLALVRYKLRIVIEELHLSDTFRYRLSTLRHETDRIAEGTKFGTGRGNVPQNENEDELPPFMRLDSVCRLLGLDAPQ